MQIELRIHFRLRTQGFGQLVQQPSLELARLHFEFRARGAIDYADRHAGMTNPVTQFRREIPLNLLAAEVLDARQDALDQHFRTRIREQHRTLRNAITRIILAQMHLVGAPIAAGASQQEILAQRPKAQEADTEFTLQATRTLGLETPLDRIAHVRRHVMKIRLALGILANSLAVVLHAQIVPALLLPSRDDDRFGAGVDTVFHEFRHGLERITLR